MNRIIKKSFIIVFLIILAAVTVKARTVTDQLGRVIRISQKPVRVISLAPNITEIVFALGKGELLKGATLYSDYPSEASVIPKVGSYVNLDLEKIIALKPDLCIGIKDGNPKTVITRLELLKIPVYAVDPKNLDSVVETVLLIGDLLGASKKADSLAINMRQRIDHIKKMINSVTYRPRVFFQIGTSPIVSAGSNTYIHELIGLAGGENVAKGKTPYPRFGPEQVIGLSPEVVIITSLPGAAVFQEVKKKWETWPDIPAVKNDRIFLDDSNLFDRPTPRLVNGLELLARLIHPELFLRHE